MCLASDEPMPMAFQNAVMDGTIQIISTYGAVITTLQGTMTASAGDWIVLGVEGEFYPVKPDIFEKTYEPLDTRHPEFNAGDRALYMRANLEHIKALIDTRVKKMDGPHRLKLNGEIHTGPVVDFTHELLEKLSQTIDLLLRSSDQI